MTTQEFDQRMSDLLITDELKPFLDKDILHNGLQTRGSGDVTRVGFAVSASLAVFELAQQEQCDALVTHHGVLSPSQLLDRITYGRLEYLIKNDIALWSAHFVGDAHPTLGNNAQILDVLGVTDRESYAEKDGVPWGILGRAAQPLTFDAILEAYKPYFSPATIAYDFGSQDISTIVSVSGGGAPKDMDRLVDAGVDLYITGEVHEWNREQFREVGIHLIGGGHYHTEMFGVKAIQKEVDSWELETTWLDLQNDV